MKAAKTVPISLSESPRSFCITGPACEMQTRSTYCSTASDTAKATTSQRVLLGRFAPPRPAPAETSGKPGAFAAPASAWSSIAVIAALPPHRVPRRPPRRGAHGA